MSWLDQHFPKSNKLHAIFNRNTIKVSFSCTQNILSMIKSHNKKVINKNVKESRSCNCSVKSEYPLNGQCQVSDIMYKCTVLSPEKTNKVYLGTSDGDFKKRFYNQRKSFNKLAQTIPPFQNIYGTKRNIKFYPDCQKGTALF